MIPMNDFQRQWLDTRDAAVAAFEAVGSSGWYVLGDEVREFEMALARYWGLDCAVGVASGLDAIEISLRVLECKPGDRVITSPLSAFATTLAIVRVGAVPVYVDCDASGMVDLDLARDALRGDASIRYCVPVHLYGNALDPDKLAALGEEFGCTIVEDCAQSIGATHRGRATGSVGRMAATSFYPTKNLGALGDGGAVLTPDEQLASAARMWRDYGQSGKYCHQVIGYNSRLDELHAAILRRVYLKRLDWWIQRRREIAAAYSRGITNPAITTLGIPPDSNPACHLYPVLAPPDRKADFMRWLRSQGVGSGEHYPILAPDQPAMEGIDFRVVGELDNAQRICRSEVSLPIHPYLKPEEIARVVEVCNAWRG
jgi:dTDP-3-amino-3,4,6-trideoxy-alpha-D-glucose transaminase